MVNRVCGLSMCSQPAGDALLNELQSTKRMPAAVGEVLAVDLLNLTPTMSLYQYILGEGKCQCACSRLTTVKVKYRRRSSADYGGAQTSRDKLLEDKWRLAGAAGIVAGGNANVLPTDSLLPPPIDGLMNGLPLAHDYWRMYVTRRAAAQH
ncbi:hydrogenase-1 operon protein HyaF [Escherichia coli]|uniref:Hydrogenase-1 operon protein HyaF n=1 Tax=Escherichia coli TaxID=562 RepID=A0A376MUV8_ECOLX|nr:hydrogenase-1 operon protein HyaF [Escherichia coli]